MWLQTSSGSRKRAPTSQTHRITSSINQDWITFASNDDNLSIYCYCSDFIFTSDSTNVKAMAAGAPLCKRVKSDSTPAPLHQRDTGRIKARELDSGNVCCDVHKHWSSLWGSVENLSRRRITANVQKCRDEENKESNPPCYCTTALMCYSSLMLEPTHNFANRRVEKMDSPVCQ